MSAGKDRGTPAADLGATGAPPSLRPQDEPPADAAQRESHWTADHTTESRDMTPAMGTPGEPASWEREHEGADVALARPAWGDAQWSFLFGPDTQYAGTEPAPGQIADASRRARSGSDPGIVQGPMILPPVWTWEVPLYFWFGGVAAGSSFVALACDLAGDHRSAAVARRLAVAAVLPSPPLLIMDLGRPFRFLNMLRIFKPRSPMNLGAWALSAFSAVGAAAVAADFAGRPRTARALGGANAVLGGYLGSYTGVLLATTAVPVWARSRLLLGPIFVATATAGGAAATRLALVSTGAIPAGHPTRHALGTVETGAMVAELALAQLNKRRLGRLAHSLETGRSGVLFKAAEAAIVTGLSLRFVRGRLGVGAHNVASVLYLAAGLAFRFAWVEAGKESAADSEAVARTARGRATRDDPGTPHPGSRLPSVHRAPGRSGSSAYAEAVRRASLAIEGVALRAGWKPGTHLTLPGLGRARRNGGRSGAPQH